MAGGDAKADGHDKVQCAECGRWFVSVANHVWRAHGVTADQAKHDLDQDALVSPEAAVGWSSWQDVADWAVANDAGWLEIGARLGASWRMARTNAKAEGVALPRGGRDSRNDQFDQQIHAVGTTLGYHGVSDLLDRTRHLNDVELAGLLGVKPERARTFRRRHGFDSPGRQYPDKGEVQAAVIARWQARFGAVGWTSWQDAIDWAQTCNGTWAEVAAHLGVSDTLVRQRAAKECVIMPRKITAHEAELLELARTQVAETSALWQARPQRLTSWLSRQRARYANGVRTRAMVELSRIDPTWHLGIREHPTHVI